MSDTPKTDSVKYHARGQFQDVVSADFARELERENAHLLVLATNAEFNRSKMERENARLQMELDASCNAEELRQVRAENTKLRECGNALRDALAFEGVKIGDLPREIKEWDALVSDLPNVQAEPDAQYPR